MNGGGQLTISRNQVLLVVGQKITLPTGVSLLPAEMERPNAQTPNDQPTFCPRKLCIATRSNANASTRCDSPLPHPKPFAQQVSRGDEFIRRDPSMLLECGLFEDG